MILSKAVKAASRINASARAGKADALDNGAELSRREKNKLRTRHNILTASRVCFSKAGFAATTMDEIAEIADVSRGTLFNYFPSKAEIVSALVHEMQDAFFEIIRQTCDNQGSLADRISIIYTKSARYLETKAVLARRLVDPVEQVGVGADGVKATLIKLVDCFENALITASDKENLRTDVAPRALAEIVLSIYNGLVYIWRVNEDYQLEFHMKQAAQLATEIILKR